MNRTKETIKAEIIDGIKADMAREGDGIQIHHAIAEVLKQYDGKPISKRIATALQKNHPEWVIYFNDNFGMFHLDVWGKATGSFLDCGSKFSALIGYESDKTVKANMFDKRPDGSCGFDGCHGYAAIDRFNKRRALLADNTALDRMAEAVYNIGYAQQYLDSFDCDSAEYQATYVIDRILKH